MSSTASGQRLAVARGEQRHPYANPAGVVIRNRGIDIAQHLAQLTSAGQGARLGQAGASDWPSVCFIAKQKLTEFVRR